MSEPASISSGIAKRYATAVFDLAKESGALAALEAYVDQMESALNDSSEGIDVIEAIVRRELQGWAG